MGLRISASGRARTPSARAANATAATWLMSSGTFCIELAPCVTIRQAPSTMVAIASIGSLAFGEMLPGRLSAMLSPTGRAMRQPAIKNASGIGITD